MKVAWRVAGALMFLAAFAVLRNEARHAREESAAWEELITLQFDADSPPATPAGSWFSRGVNAGADAARREATVAYWLGRYDALVERNGGADDPDVLFVAANAAFRAARRGRPLGPEAARRLDPVLQAYGDVLEAAPRHADASYNLEYVVRLQDQLRVMKETPPAETGNVPGADPIPIGDLPYGPTVHGRPGTPPPEPRGDDLEILRPRDPGERESGPDQAPGGTIRRKG